MFNPCLSSKFKKDYKLSIKKGLDLEKLDLVMEKLIKGAVLDRKYRDHKLAGNYKNHRECHIEPDWLLIYQITENTIVFVRTGTHSDLFQK